MAGMEEKRNVKEDMMIKPVCTKSLRRLRPRREDIIKRYFTK